MHVSRSSKVAPEPPSAAADGSAAASNNGLFVTPLPPQQTNKPLSERTPPPADESAASPAAAAAAPSEDSDNSSRATPTPAPLPPPPQAVDVARGGASEQQQPHALAGPPPPLIMAPTSPDSAKEWLRVFVGTWNLHGTNPDEDLSSWLGSPSASSSSAGASADSGRWPTADASSTLRSQGGAPDVMAIGTQEAERTIQNSFIVPSKAKWMARLEAAIGSGYACVGSQTLCALHIAVFVRTSLLPLVSNVQVAHVANGLGNGTIGNKGAVALAMCVGRTSFLFINAHFAAHQTKVEQRNADFARIDTMLPLCPQKPKHAVTVDGGAALPPTPSADGTEEQAAAAAAAAAVSAATPAAGTVPSAIAIVPDSPSPGAATAAAAASSAAAAASSSSASARFDRAFWFGDLNYRVNGNREMVDALLAPADERARALPTWESDAAHWEAMRAVLLNNDQLRAEMRARRVFNGWSEGEIHFRPTYKFDKRVAGAYDQSEKRRIPAYTDRVLWRAPVQPGEAPIGGTSSQGADATTLSANRKPPPQSAVEILRYDAIPTLCSSDHKPVVAEFAVSYVGAPLASAGIRSSISSHHRHARFGSSKSAVVNPSPRGEQPASSTSSSQSAVCSVM